MITELFGEEVLYQDIDTVKKLILSLPPAQKERTSYLLHDWASAVGRKLTAQDFKDVGV